MILAMTKLEKIRLVIEALGIGVGIWTTVSERRREDRDNERDAVIAAMAKRIEELEAMLAKRRR